jgi:5-methylcytosine-specific restriction endonuclease McrA
MEVFTRKDVVDTYGNACFYCGGDFDWLDHYIPIKHGGDHTMTNVRPSCRTCNLAKGDSMPPWPKAAI